MGEVASRVKLLKRKLTIGTAAWAAFKEQENVFDSESGLSVARGASQRLGGDLEIRLEVFDFLYLGSDLYFVDARFSDTKERIPNMSPWLLTQSISVENYRNFYSTMRGRLLGTRYHDFNLISTPYYLVDWQFGYKWKIWNFSVAIENLFNRSWNDSAFAYESRPYSSEATYKGLHITPGTPLALTVRVQAEF